VNLPPERATTPEPPIPVYSDVCRLDPGAPPEYEQPPDMPPPEEALDHAQWAANAAIRYARALRAYAEQVRADRRHCAQETRANSLARDAWLDRMAEAAEAGAER
jgi:hypothetical protein